MTMRQGLQSSRAGAVISRRTYPVIALKYGRSGNNRGRRRAMALPPPLVGLSVAPVAAAPAN